MAKVDAGVTDASGVKATLTTLDAVAIIVGIVVGAGIFGLPKLVALNVASPALFLLAWGLGGVIALVGALCYAELATGYPQAGGDYHYLSRTFGPDVSFLYSWARMTVIQTGSIATLSFVFGSYAASLAGSSGKGLASTPAFWAALGVTGLTLLNVAGVRQGKGAQKLLTAVKVVGVAVVVLVGIGLSAPAPAVPVAAGTAAPFGMAMVFVLFTYGGWNEAAFISAELRDVRRNMVRAILSSIGLITFLYLLINVAYLRTLGLGGLRGSDAIAVDLMRGVIGPKAAAAIGCLVAISALGAANGDIFTGARTNYALGRDTRLLAFLGRWNARAGTPTHALLLQGVIVLGLVLLGHRTHQGLQAMVDYTAPVFWFFFLLTGLSLFVLRAREPDAPRPFRVPLYPLTPLLFCIVCVYMLNATLNYASAGALAGVAVLLAGIPVLLLARWYGREAPHGERSPEE